MGGAQTTGPDGDCLKDPSRLFTRGSEVRFTSELQFVVQRGTIASAGQCCLRSKFWQHLRMLFGFSLKLGPPKFPPSFRSPSISILFTTSCRRQAQPGVCCAPGRLLALLE